MIAHGFDDAPILTRGRRPGLLSLGEPISLEKLCV